MNTIALISSKGIWMKLYKMTPGVNSRFGVYRLSKKIIEVVMKQSFLASTISVGTHCF